MIMGKGLWANESNLLPAFEKRTSVKVGYCKI